MRPRIYRETHQHPVQLKHSDPPRVEIELYLVDREAFFPYMLAHPVHLHCVTPMIRPRAMQGVSNKVGIWITYFTILPDFLQGILSNKKNRYKIQITNVCLGSLDGQFKRGR